MNLIKVTHFGKVENEGRIEAFNVLNHPAFADPNTTFGSAAFGTITAMLSKPGLLAVRNHGAADPVVDQVQVLNPDRAASTRPGGRPPPGRFPFPAGRHLGYAGSRGIPAGRAPLSSRGTPSWSGAL